MTALRGASVNEAIDNVRCPWEVLKPRVCVAVLIHDKSVPLKLSNKFSLSFFITAGICYKSVTDIAAS